MTALLLPQKPERQWSFHLVVSQNSMHATVLNRLARKDRNYPHRLLCDTGCTLCGLPSLTISRHCVYFSCLIPHFLLGHKFLYLPHIPLSPAFINPKPNPSAYKNHHMVCCVVLTVLWNHYVSDVNSSHMICAMLFVHLHRSMPEARFL